MAEGPEEGLLNRVHQRRRALGDLLAIDSHPSFHDYLFRQALDRYTALTGGDPGSILAIGANHREAEALTKAPFDRILLTGISEPSEAIQAVEARDPRVSYRVENAEHLDLESRSFDLVFCKESLYHLARPVLGLYEMLRVCRRAALWIEPCDTLAGRLFERLGLASVYETRQVGNLSARDNFVYRWSRRQIECLLESYYLRSGYTLELTQGWMSSRFNAHPSATVRRAAALAGFGLGFAPGSRGNYLTALVLPGSDLPPDPLQAGRLNP